MKLTVDITSVCNLDCKYCYQDREGELSMKRILANVERFNPHVVEIGGGEPFFHPRFYELVSGLIKEGRAVNIATNGTLPYSGLFSLPDKEKIMVQVSLPASSKELYERITGHNFLDNVIENTKRFSKHFRTQLNAPLYDENFLELGNLADLAKSLGLAIRFSLVMPVGRASNLNMLSEQQIRELKRYVLEKELSGESVDCGIVHENNCPVVESYYGIPKTSACPGEEKQKVYVSPSGELRECEFLQTKFLEVENAIR